MALERRVAQVLAGLGGLAYAWWASGLAPFHTTAYLAVAVPAALVAVGLLLGLRAPSPTSTPSTTRLAPPLVLVGLALGLELAALALGGRDPQVPSLSSELDHLVATRPEHLASFAVWLALGAWLTRRRRGVELW